uniref:hypothetical protein n=1 Tax=Thaumasiovibrio occultus TaxID=1891184 RepID=UPI00131B3ED0|nr:hypothetical protein [Thaumasiovibrio occultus]
MSDFFDLIQAPDNRRGLIRVMDTIVELCENVQDDFHLQFGLSSPVYEGLCDGLSLNEFDGIRLLKKKEMAKGWCEDRPLYALLFSYHRFQDSPGRAEFVALFLAQYYALANNRVGQIASSTKLDIRLKESCDRFRLLMQSCESMKPSKYIHYSPPEIACLLRQDRDMDTTLAEYQKSYMTQLAHFFAADWKETKGHFRVSPTSSLRAIGRGVAAHVLGDPDLLLHFGHGKKNDEKDGLAAGDTMLLPQIVEDCSMPARDAAQGPFLSNIGNAKKRSMIQQSYTRRVRRQYNRSPASISLVSGRDLALLFDALNSLSLQHYTVQGVPKSVIGMALYLSLILGKSIDELCGLSISSQPSLDGIYIDEKGDWWLSFGLASIVKRSSRPVESRRFEPVTNYVHWDCPKSVRRVVRQAHRSDLLGYKGALIPREYLQEVNQACRHWVERWARRQSANLSCQSIEAFLLMTTLADEEIDPTCLDFAFRTTSLVTRTTRHYSYYTLSCLASNLEKIWRTIHLRMDESDALPTDLLTWIPQSTESGIGSCFVPTLATQREMVACLQHPLRSKDKQVYRELVAMMRYHNAYAAYTSYLVLYATGYRAVYNPLPSLSMVLARYQLVVISDKDNSDYAHTRVVCLPTVLAEQLANYTRHLLALRTRLIALDPRLGRQLTEWLEQHVPNDTIATARQWFHDHKNAKDRPGPLFYFSEDTGDVNVVSPSWLKTQLPFSVPVNAGRHNLQSYLLEQQCPSELINFQLGHWLSGQAFLGDYSCFDYQSATQYLRPLLDKMLEERGWQSIPSLLR